MISVIACSENLLLLRSLDSLLYLVLIIILFHLSIPFSPVSQTQRLSSGMSASTLVQDPAQDVLISQTEILRVGGDDVPGSAHAGVHAPLDHNLLGLVLAPADHLEVLRHGASGCATQLPRLRVRRPPPNNEPLSGPSRPRAGAGS